jgi:hypothetical protein
VRRAAFLLAPLLVAATPALAVDAAKLNCTLDSLTPATRAALDAGGRDLVSSATPKDPPKDAQDAVDAAAKACGAKYHWSSDLVEVDGTYAIATIVSAQAVAVAREKGLDADGLVAAAHALSDDEKKAMYADHDLAGKAAAEVLRKFGLTGQDDKARIAGMLVMMTALVDGQKATFLAS